ncbi:hypothetical protein [Streptomyces sp. RB13]|uniref:hypothetical protein n=1 Tax=Streptomyces sp. RB13 TaxID=2950978 RepID=UPI002FC85260
MHRLHHPPQPAHSNSRVDPPRTRPAPRPHLHPPPASLKRSQTAHPLDIRPVPELTRARRTARRPPTAAWASTITTRWYDHHQHLHQRWHTRLRRLRATNPHLTPGPVSPALTCRSLITYPETLTLAAALDPAQNN